VAPSRDKLIPKRAQSDEITADAVQPARAYRLFKTGGLCSIADDVLPILTEGRRVDPRRRKPCSSDLRRAAIDEELDAGDVGAVVAREEHHTLAKIVRGAHSGEWYGSGERRFCFIRQELREVWGVG
jgi:hypothetical protein